MGPWARKATGVAVLVMMLALVAAPAFANGAYALKLNVPSHPKPGTYRASGLARVARGEEYVAVIVDTHKCSNLKTETTRAETSGGRGVAAFALGQVLVSGHFSEAFPLNKDEKKWHYMCGFLYNVVGFGVTHTTTNSAVKLHFSVS